MTEIEKLKEGRRISKQLYEQAKANYENIYANATPEVRAQLDGLMQSAQNYSAADPTNNRSAREFATQMYNNAVAIVNGTYSEAPSAIASTKNIFDGYSHDENLNNANTLTSRYLGSNTAGRTTAGRVGTAYSSQATATTGTSSDNPYYTYKWNNGLSGAWSIAGEDFNARLNRFADALIQNIDTTLGKQQEGKKIKGISSTELGNFEQYKAALEQLKAKVGKTDSTGKPYSNLDLTKELLKIVPHLGVTEEGFTTFFDGVLPITPASQKAKQDLINNGYTFNKTTTGNAKLDALINQNHWSIGTKGDTDYLYDENYNLVNNPATYIDDDYLNSSAYGSGYIIGADGKFTTNLGSITDLNNPFYQQLNQYRTSLINNNKNRFISSTGIWDDTSSMSDKDLVNHFSAQLRGKRIIDVGRYFEGNNGVIATVDDNNWENHIDQFGNLKLNDPSITFYYEDGNGGFNTSKDYRQVGTVNLHNDEETAGGFNNFVDFGSLLAGITTTLTDLTDDANRAGESRNFWHGNGENWFNRGPKNPLSDGANETIDLQNDIRGQESKVARMLLFLGTATDAEIAAAGSTGAGAGKHATRELRIMKSNWFSNGRALEALKFIAEQIKVDHSVIGNEKLAQAWKQLLLQYKDDLAAASGTAVATTPITTTTSTVASSKQGGILKAAWGATLDGAGTPIQPVAAGTSIYDNLRLKASTSLNDFRALEQRAAARGVNTAVQAASEQKWTSSDTMRALALAQDIASTVAAVSAAVDGAAGSVTSEVLGFTAMGTDLAADIADDSMTAGDVAKNAAINAGFAALSFIPGLKGTKMIKSAARILPHAVGMLMSAGVVLNPEVYKSIDKIVNAGEAGKEKVTTKDWQNVMIALRAVSGLTRGAATAKTAHTNQKRLESLDSTVDKNKKYLNLGKGKEAIPFTEKEAATINAGLKEGASEEAITKANELLAPHGKTVDDIEIETKGAWYDKLRGNGVKTAKEADAPSSTDPVKLAEELAKEDAAYKLKILDSKWQQFLAGSDKALSHLMPGVKGGTTYSPFLLQMLRNYGAVKAQRDVEPGGSVKDPTSGIGTTSALREQLYKQSPYGIKGEALNTSKLYEEARSKAAEGAEHKNLDETLEAYNTFSDPSIAGGKDMNLLRAEREALTAARTAKEAEHESAVKVSNAKQKEIDDLDALNEEWKEMYRPHSAFKKDLAEWKAMVEEAKKAPTTGKGSGKAKRIIKEYEPKIKAAEEKYEETRKKVAEGRASRAELERAAAELKRKATDAETALTNAKAAEKAGIDNIKALREAVRTKNTLSKDAALASAIETTGTKVNQSTLRDISTVDVNDNTLEIPRGTKVISLKGLTDEEMKRFIPESAVKISKEEAMKLFPSKDAGKVNGAVFMNDKLYIFNNGGRVTNKYLHLRH